MANRTCSSFGTASRQGTLLLHAQGRGLTHGNKDKVQLWQKSKRGTPLPHAQGMEAYGVRAFAEALEVVPSTLAENAGLNPIEICTQLRGRHARGESAAGINVRKVRAPLAAAGRISRFAVMAFREQRVSKDVLVVCTAGACKADQLATCRILSAC